MSTAVPATITGIHRLPNSPDGNPRWRLDTLLSSGAPAQFHTGRNSQVGYFFSPAIVGRAVTLYCNAKGDVIGLDKP